MSEPPTVSSAAISMSEVTKTFRNNVQALRGVNLTVNRGEFVAITGPSGCGKSTTLNLIGALDVPTSGGLVVNGKNLRDVDDLSRYRREQVGIVFQLHNLLPQQSVLSNVGAAMFGTPTSLTDRRQRALELLAEVGLEGRAHRLPTELSGGERQRVAIARALANRPAVLLADEPTGSLDSDATALVMQLFKRVHGEGVTILLVTHDLAVAGWADRTIEMTDGRVVSTGQAHRAA